MSSPLVNIAGLTTIQQKRIEAVSGSLSHVADLGIYRTRRYWKKLKEAREIVAAHDKAQSSHATFATPIVAPGAGGIPHEQHAR